jgi:S-adenosylmethionine hydrolase
MAAGLVTLLTDFGHRDPYVGIMKGVLHSRASALRGIVDLTHEVPAQDVRTASFFLSRSWSWFPEGTVHVAVVDPGVGSGRGVLAARHRGHLFLAPDNGLLTPLLDGGAEARVLDLERFALPGVSRTFHGRDVFAPAAAALASDVPFEEAGHEAAAWERLELPAASGPEGEVILVDVYGNLVTNLDSVLVADGSRRWVVEVAGARVPLRGTYAEAGTGELLALVDSYGLVEIARRDGDAAAELGAGVGTSAVLRNDV